MACGSSRQLVRETTSSKQTYEVRDTVRQEVMVALHDTLREVTTITIRLGNDGDTVFQSVVTDRLAARDAAGFRVQDSRQTVKADTVYVAMRDSVLVRDSRLGGGIQSGRTALHTTLKWVFWIIVALVILILVLRFGRKRVL